MNNNYYNIINNVNNHNDNINTNSNSSYYDTQLANSYRLEYYK